MCLQLQVTLPARQIASTAIGCEYEGFAEYSHKRQSQNTNGGSCKVIIFNRQDELFGKLCDLCTLVAGNTVSYD